MLTEPTPAQDSASHIIPTIMPRMPWRVKTVKPLENFSLWVCFNDGVEGIVDLSARVHSSQAGVFSTLATPKVFEAVHVQYGAVVWENGVDIAPDAMYAAIKAHGKWVLN
jgi:Protein of unknown function (DUF2442)